jgi:hypothetical protein
LGVAAFDGPEGDLIPRSKVDASGGRYAPWKGGEVVDAGWSGYHLSSTARSAATSIIQILGQLEEEVVLGVSPFRGNEPAAHESLRVLDAFEKEVIEVIPPFG